MRIVFMGTPGFAKKILRALIDAGQTPVGVVTQPDRPAGRHNLLSPPPTKILAQAHGIEVIQPRKVKTGRKLRRALERWAPDLGIVAAYGRVLPDHILCSPRLACVNVHASLLPRYRGPAPIQWAILRGETQTGITLIRMDAGVDTGPILASRTIPIGPDETADRLHDRLADLGASLLVSCLPRIEAADLPAIEQDHSMATHAPMLSRSDARIDWDRPATMLHNRVRGMHPWPGSLTTLEGRPLKVFPPTRAVESDDRPAAPGTVVSLDGWTLTVACGEGALRITEVQRAGKRRMSVAQWLRGFALPVGTLLGGD